MKRFHKVFSHWEIWDEYIENTIVEDIDNEIKKENVSKEKRSSVFGEYSGHLYKKDYLMTKREASFYRTLQWYLQDKDYIICPKVRIEDIIWVRSNFWFRPWKVSWRLDRSHIDFLLIWKTDLKTKYAIEVDDYTHDSYSGKERDTVKNEACAIAGIPLLRFRDTSEIKEIFTIHWV